MNRKQVVQVQNTTPSSCHEQRLDKNWIELTTKIHIQQCLMPQLLRSNVLPHEVELLQYFEGSNLKPVLSKHDLSNAYKF
jgi:hypothetical protein